MPRKLYSSNEFLTILKSKCKKLDLDEEKIDQRLLLYLVETGIVYPVRVKGDVYEKKKYTRTDLKIMELLLKDFAQPDSDKESGSGRRNIKAAIEQLGKKIDKEQLIEKLENVQDENEKLILREAYKRILMRSSVMGYQSPEKTDILGIRRGERTLIFLNEYNVPTKEKLFHDILERIVQGAVNEMVVLITRARAWHVAAGLQKNLTSSKEKTNMMFAVEYRFMVRNIEEAIFKSKKGKRLGKKIDEKLIWRQLTRYLRQEAITRGIEWEKMDHIWVINEVSDKFYQKWPEGFNYLETERLLGMTFEKALKKRVSVISVYDKRNFINSMLEKNKNVLKELAELIKDHHRIFIIHDDKLIKGTKVTETLLHWIDDNLND